MSRPKKEKLPPQDPKSGAQIVQRLKIGLIGDQQARDSILARRLGCGPDRITRARQDDTRPYDLCVLAAEEEGLTLDWLLAGRGPQRREERGEGPARAGGERRYDLAEAEAQMTVFRGWLDDYWHGANLKVRWWILEQLRRCLDEYNQHLRGGPARR